MSGPPMQEFRFVGPAAPRAKHISPEVWEQHKEILRELYQTMTLELLMPIMKVKYQFEPSKRQYIHQFDKWGFKKYKTEEPSTNPLADTIKRQRSLQSLQSRYSVQSRSSKPIPPVKKKNKLDAFIAAREPLPAAFGSSWGSAASPSSAALPAAPSLSTRVNAEQDAFSPASDASRPTTVDPYATLGLAFGSQDALEPTAQEEKAKDTPMTEIHGAPKDIHIDLQMREGSPAGTTTPAHHDAEPFPAYSDPFADPTAEDANAVSARARGKMPMHLRELRHESPASVDGMSWAARTETSTGGVSSYNGGEAEDEADDIASFNGSNWTTSTPRAGSFDDDLLPTDWRWGSVEELTQLSRTVDSNRPIDTFTERDMASIKRAAEYLHTLLYNKDSFPLYALLMKRQKFLNPTGSRLRRLAITASMGATAAEHGDITRSMLQEELNKLKGKESEHAVEVFLLNIGFAHSHACRCAFDKSKPYYNSAVKIAEDSSQTGLVDQLPPDDRSLDLLLFAWLAALERPDTGGLTMVGSPARSNWKSATSERLESAILERVPGPFEIKDGKMGNPCLRSCLQWCNRELQGITALPGSWKSMSSKSTGKAKSEAAVLWAEIVALFTYLWDRMYHFTMASTTESSETELWVKQAEPLMGVDASTVLMLVCWRINAATTWKRSKSEGQLVARLQAGAELLSLYPDRELARTFLRSFANWNVLSKWPEWRHNFQKIARDQVLCLLERVLLTHFTEIRRNLDGASTPVRALGIMASTLLPTLASSLSSLDLNAFQKAKDKFERTLKSVVSHRAGRPSSVISGVSCGRSMLTMSELSLALKTSLNLSGSLRGSGSSKNRLRLSEDNRMEEVADQADRRSRISAR